MLSPRRSLLAVVVISAAAALTAQILHGSWPAAAVFLDDAAQLLAALTAVASCWWYGRRAKGAARTWRWLMAIGFLGWATGQALWLWYRVVDGILLPTPSWADVGYLILPFFALAALLVLAAGNPPRPTAQPELVGRRLSRVVLVLDSVIVAALIFLLTWATSLGAVIQAHAASPLAYAVAISYPVTDLMLVTIVALLILFRRWQPEQRPQLLALWLGLVALSISDSFFAYAVSRGAEEIPPIYDFGFIAGPALIALAARRGGRREHPADAADHTKVGELTHLLLPYIPLVATGVLIIADVAFSTQLDRVETYLGLLVIILVVIRQLMTLLENRILLKRVRVSQAQLEYQAYHDPLTGLANHTLFNTQLTKAVEAHRLEQRQLALLYLDLDDFKHVNDSLGHAIGDGVLRSVAERLRTIAGQTGTVARLGGDEFAMLIEDAADPETIGKLMARDLCEPCDVGGRLVTLSASVGVVATGPHEPDLTVDTLLRRADAAMYEAKQRGKATSVFHQGELAENAQPEVATLLEAALRNRPYAGTIEVHYQPIVHMITGRTVAVEALARWSNPALGSVPPDTFVAAAESSGLVAQLDDLVLDIACQDAVALAHRRGGELLRIHVNISASRLGGPQLESSVRDTLRRHDLPGASLVLEITETSQIINLTAAAESIRRLRELGVHFALDDFGAGYNTLPQLHALPVDIVKLDHMLTALTDDQDRTDAMGRSIVSISDALGIAVIAERVETSEQAQRLLSWGCTLGQGYLYGKPVPMNALQLHLADVS